MFSRTATLLGSLLMAFSLCGCSGLRTDPIAQAQVAKPSLYRREGAVRSTERKPVDRSPSIALETTGSIPTPAVSEEGYETRERELQSEMKKLRPGTPEWLALRAQMDQNTAALRELNLSRLKICNGC